MRILMLAVVLMVGACGEGQPVPPGTLAAECCKGVKPDCTMKPIGKQSICAICRCHTCDGAPVADRVCKNPADELCGSEYHGVGEDDTVIEHEPCP